MSTAWLVCAAVLLAAAAVCGIAASRRDTAEAIVAVELAGTLATVVLVCLTVGYQRSSYANLPVLAAVLTWAGSLVYARFLERETL